MEQDIISMLDTLAEYEARSHLMKLDRDALLEQVKIPEEVQAIHDEGERRKRNIEIACANQINILDESMKWELAAVVIPPEVKAVLDGIDAKRAEIQNKYSAAKQNRRESAEAAKAKINEEFSSKVAGVYQQVATRKAEINAEFSEKIDAAEDNIAKLTDKIKKAVASFGTTVKGQFKQAVFTKGRVTWMTDKLDGYAEAHPEILKFRKVGEPSVSIRANGK